MSASAATVTATASKLTVTAKVTVVFRDSWAVERARLKRTRIAKMAKQETDTWWRDNVLAARLELLDRFLNCEPLSQEDQRWLDIFLHEADSWDIADYGHQLG